MAGPAFLFVVILGANLAKGYDQTDVGKCCSTCDCQEYSIARGSWTKESCCKSGNPCWCDQSDRCQPSCSPSITQQATLGRCYSTKNCQQYSQAGGLWTKSDCCSSRGLCWCDQTGKCQPSCSLESTPSTATLGKCYSARDCTSYSASGGKWTQVDCCSSGGRCWCDQYGRCQPSCLAVSTDQQGIIVNLGKCYSTRDCQQYSAAGGKWTKKDCCLSGSYCWCDTNRKCQPSCSNSTNEQSPLGKCYSTRDCQQYSVAGGSWTKRDCCLSSGRCWCDKYGRCQPTCSTSTPQPNAVTTLGKCYSTRDCQSYSKAGGSWTKEDCCLTGGLCWCDLNQVCQPSCSASTHATTKPTTAFPPKSPTTHVHTDPVAVRTSAPGTFPPNFPTQHTEPASSTTAFPPKPPTIHTNPVAMHTFAPSTFLPNFPTQHTEPASSTLGKCYTTYDCDPESVAYGQWTIEHCCLSGSPCWCDLHKQCQPSCAITQNLASETQTASSWIVPTGSKQSYTTSWNLMYLWFLVIVVICPCLCCFWICRRYKARLPNNLNLTYIRVNTDPSTPSKPSSMEC